MTHSEKILKLIEIGSYWNPRLESSSDKKTWVSSGRFPPAGQYIGPDQPREIKTCDFCDKKSIATVILGNSWTRFTGPQEIIWLCKIHEFILMLTIASNNAIALDKFQNGFCLCGEKIIQDSFGDYCPNEGCLL